MRAFAYAYLTATVVAVLILFLLQLPGVILLLVIYSMGLGYFLVLPILNICFWIVAFAPAALGAWINWRIGAVIATVLLALAVSFPRWLPNPTHEGIPLLEKPFAATGPVAVRSIEISSFGKTREERAIVEEAVNALKRNTNLDWMRIERKVYRRRQGILYEIRADQENLQRVADVIISIPDTEHAAAWGNASLSPWRVEDVSGYLIHDTRADKPLARNLSLKLERAIAPLRIHATGVRMESNSDPKIEFVRAPYGEVAKDPEQTLENDLKTLGLWRGATNPLLEPDNPTNSTAKSVDAVLEEMLLDQELAQHKGHRTRSPDSFERQVIKDFNGQLKSRLGISERIDLISRLERSKIPRLDRRLIIEIAEETPLLMQRMVDLYYTDLADEPSLSSVLERVAPYDAYAPLARAISADRTRFLMAFGAARRHQRAFFIENIFEFGVADPLEILRTLFLPKPPGDPLEERFVQGYRAIWKEEWRRGEILEYVRSGGDLDKSDMQEEADLTLRMLLSREDMPGDVLISFVKDWVLTRRSPILHDYEVLLEVLARLEEIGAQELRANLLVYFADLIEFRPHWKDPPT